MVETPLIVTLAVALTAGLVLGYITNALRLSPIVGYLLAGIVIGPSTPGVIADQHLAEQLAEVGVMLLMFGVGLNFQFEELLAVRRIAIPGAVAQIGVATLLGAVTAHLFGWSTSAGIVYGLSLSVASTVVLTRILVDNRQLHTPTGHVAIGWLLVEDVVTVLALVVIPILFSPRGSLSEVVAAFGVLAVKLLILGTAIIKLGPRVIPWMLTCAAKSSSRELFTLTVLVVALGLATASAMFFDVSMALGAFLAGMVVGKSEFSLRAASEALPLRDAFAVLFFVSVGMLLDLTILMDHLPLVLATLAVVVVGKTVAAFVIVLLLGYAIRVALGVSVALAQIGEFSFILASLGKQLAILDDRAINALVATAILSITLNPVLFRLLPYLENWVSGNPKLYLLLSSRLHRQVPAQEGKNSNAPALHGHAVIVGYGPIGRTVVRLLQENGVPFVIVELDLETTRQLRLEGFAVTYGDACRRETLDDAGIAAARALIVTASSVSDPGDLVREAKSLNPNIRIIARTAYARELDALRAAGCEVVFSGEGEVALALIEEVLRELGATAEQIERERYRVRGEIIGPQNLLS